MIPVAAEWLPEREACLHNSHKQDTELPLQAIDLVLIGSQDNHANQNPRGTEKIINHKS